jgi:hypothetical protein
MGKEHLTSGKRIELPDPVFKPMAACPDAVALNGAGSNLIAWCVLRDDAE